MGFTHIDDDGQILDISIIGGRLVASIEYETDFSTDGGHTFERETAAIEINQNKIPFLIQFLSSQLS